jgi:hypothetical protein
MKEEEGKRDKKNRQGKGTDGEGVIYSEEGGRENASSRRVYETSEEVYARPEALLSTRSVSL